VPVSTDSTVEVQVSRNIDASPERVFDAWLDPASVRKWLFATPTGQMLKVEVDGRQGGKFVIVERRPDIDAEHVGEYVELHRPSRLVFDFSVPQYSAESTRIAVDITPDGPGSKVTLTHEGVLADYAERTKAGWTGILDGLAATLG
jgi:uncharacterized protein YndB with AHSA1/START domain